MSLPTLVQQRIVGDRNLVIVRDQVAAILKANFENQRALAEADDADPKPYDVRVFVERSDCRGEFMSRDEDEPTAAAKRDRRTIVSICAEGTAYDRKRSGPSERRQADGVYSIDFYSLGISEDSSDGFVPGDKAAANEVLRVFGLVDSILAADVNVSLGMLGVVGTAWLHKFNMMELSSDDRDRPQVERVAVGRAELHVSFLEFSPQYQAQPLELISAAVLRKETGEIYFKTNPPLGV